jgi:preprotein translocase subunit SecF
MQSPDCKLKTGDKKMLQILEKTNINFIGKRHYALAVSGVLVILGIVAFISIFLGKANLGIDFAG